MNALPIWLSVIGVMFAIGCICRIESICEQITKAVSTTNGVAELRSGWLTNFVVRNAHARVSRAGAKYQIQIWAGLWWFNSGEAFETQYDSQAEEGGKHVTKRLGEIREVLCVDRRVVWAERPTGTDWPGP